MDEREKFWSDTPEAEELRQRLKEAAELVRKRLYAKARADALGIMRTSPEALIRADSDEFWQAWNGIKKDDDLNKREIIPLGGGPAKGKGSRSKRKKDKKGTKIFTNIWDGI